MKTQSEAVAWLNAQVGQHLDYDHVYGQQCVDFFNFYYQFVTGDNPYADGYQVAGAKSLFGVVNNRLNRIPDSTSLVPQPGDVAVYGSTWGGGLGHVEVCLASDANGATFIGENEHGNPSEGVVKVYRTWPQMHGLEGVLRFNFAVPVPANQPASGHPQMPPVGSEIQLLPTQVRTTFRPGTTNKAGQIDVTNNNFIYTVRDYDSSYPGRIIINSASGGGDGVALALYYTSGQIISGWKQV